MVSTSSDITLDPGYYGLIVTAGADTIDLPEVAAVFSYTATTVVVGTQFYIVNRTGADIVIAAYNPAGTTNDDFFNGVGGTNFFPISNNASNTFTAVRIISNEGDWDVMD
jgi:hypothetical protein